MLVGLVAAISATLAFGRGTSHAVAASCANDVINSGTLTIGTDNPAYPPWFGGGTKKGTPWKINDPSTGKGFESAVAYAIAQKLGFSHANVKWVYTPFNRSYAPGKKSFDFDINEISYTPARAKVVSFSTSYYDVNQALVVRKGTPIAKVHSIAGLKPYKLGAQLGTTSYAFITSKIKPSKQPAVYPQNAGAVTALKNGQIDGLVVDFPSTGYITGVQVPNSVVVGRLPTQGTQEHFGLVFQKGNPLVTCVDKALAAMKADGTLKGLENKWLAGSAPLLK